MTRGDFGKCMAFLNACLQRDIPRETQEAWFLILGTLEKTDLEKAIVAVVRGYKFSGLPPVSLFLQAAGSTVGIVDNDAQAVLAWDTAFNAISKHGGYVSVKWDDSAIPAAIGTVAQSWVTFCEMPTDDLLRFIKPKFIEAWKAHRAAGTNRNAVSLGILARDASRIGGDSPEPVRIGEQQPAVIGFGATDAKALPAPNVPLLTLAGGLAESITIPPDETESPAATPKREPSPLPTDEEWRANAAKQKHLLEVKYGILEKVGA